MFVIFVALKLILTTSERLYRVDSYAGKIYLRECDGDLVLPHDEIVQ